MRIQARRGGVAGTHPKCLIQMRRLENSSLKRWHFGWNLKEMSEGYVEFNKNRCAYYFPIPVDQMYTIIHTGIILSVFNELYIANLVSAFANINTNVRITTGQSLSLNCYCCSKEMINFSSRVLWLSFLEDAKWCKDYVSKDYKARHACFFYFLKYT